jgi:hypothetical protein
LTAPALALIEIAPPPSAAASTWSPQKTAAGIAGGVGVVGVVVGSVVGALSLSKHGEAVAACPSATYHYQCPTLAGTDDWNEATSLGTVSTVAFIAGGIGIATASILWLTSPSGRPTHPTSASSKLQLAPVVGVRSTGITLRAAW